jgi:transketolase C-terminal domain/subunit
MRSPSGVIYDRDFLFSFGRGYVVKESAEDKAVLVSSGRGVHEALAAAEALEESGIKVKVVDMPSVDKALLLKLCDSGKPLVIAEQNNGFILSEYQKLLFTLGKAVDPSRFMAINTLDEQGKPQYIHSGTYQQLIDKFGLSPAQLAESLKKLIIRS